MYFESEDDKAIKEILLSSFSYAFFNHFHAP